MAYIKTIMRIGAAAAVAGLTIIPGSKAMAEGWFSLPEPATLSDGQEICLLFSSDATPFVGIQVYAQDAYLVMKGDPIYGIAPGHIATISFPTGQSVPAALFKDSADIDLALVHVSRGAQPQPVDLDAIIDQFTVAGDFSVRGDGLNFALPALADASQEIATLRECLTELDRD